MGIFNKCKVCGRSGFLMPLATGGVCGSCNLTMQRTFRILKESADIVNNSKNIDTRISRSEFAIGLLEEVISTYEAKGVGLNPMPSTLLSPAKQILEELLKEKAEQPAKKTRGAKARLLTDQQAAQVVLKAVNEALADLEQVVVRYKESGRAINAGMMRGQASALLSCAEEYGLKIIVKGELGKLMEAPAVEGDHGIPLMISKAHVDAVLNNASVRIKGLLPEDVVKLNIIMVSDYLIRGKPREMVKHIQETIMLDGQPAPSYRAERIADSIPTIVNRMADKVYPRKLKD